MATSVLSSKAGLSPEEALKEWSDAPAYVAMEEYLEWSRDLSFSEGSPRAKSYPPKHREYARRRQALESAFIEMLRSGAVLASGIQKGANGREVIDPSLWDILEIAYEFDMIVGSDRIYEGAEFFGPSAVPRNIRKVPAWLLEQRNTFIHQSDYRHVSVGGFDFSLGEICAKVVQLLHAAALQDHQQWLVGKDLLEKAGSQQMKLGDLFKSVKNWRELIESDKQGYYRLRLR
jgi:hypothetical protein